MDVIKTETYLLKIFYVKHPVVPVLIVNVTLLMLILMSYYCMATSFDHITVILRPTNSIQMHVH
jgi:hypothetical protein